MLYDPRDNAVMSFDCWGTSTSRMAALDLADALCDDLYAMAQEPLNDSVYGYGAQIASTIWMPDTGGRSKYVVTAVVSARKATSAA